MQTLLPHLLLILPQSSPDDHFRVALHHHELDVPYPQALLGRQCACRLKLLHDARHLLRGDLQCSRRERRSSRSLPMKLLLQLQVPSPAQLLRVVVVVPGRSGRPVASCVSTCSMLRSQLVSAP